MPSGDRDSNFLFWVLVGSRRSSGMEFHRLDEIAGCVIRMTTRWLGLSSLDVVHSVKLGGLFIRVPSAGGPFVNMAFIHQIKGATSRLEIAFMYLFIAEMWNE